MNFGTILIERFLGDIRNISVDGMWINAEITPSKNIDKLNDFFAAMVDEENVFEEAN